MNAKDLVRRRAMRVLTKVFVSQKLPPALSYFFHRDFLFAGLPT
jgi:hypothetical protein